MFQNEERESAAVVNQAIDYIYANLTEPLKVEWIADHCCFSRHHFNRMFRSVMGESVYAFCKRVRLEAAACLVLKHPHLPITRIASDFGYSSSNFTSAFVKHFSFNPSECREGRPPDYVGERNRALIDRILSFREQPRLPFSGQVSVRELPEMFLYYRRILGPYCNLQEQWMALFKTLPGDLFQKTEPLFFGLTYSDPLVTDASRCLYDLCISVPEPSVIPYHHVEAGTWLVYHYEGHIHSLWEEYNNFLTFYVPHAYPQIRSRRCMEYYYPESRPHHVNMDICLRLTGSGL